MKRRVLGAWLVLMALIGALWLAYFFSSSKRDKGSDMAESCRAHVKGICMALSVYAADNNDRLPSYGWSDAVFPYVRAESYLRCPVIARTGPSQYGYALSSTCAGGNIEIIGGEPLIFDSVDLRRSAVRDVSTMPKPERHPRGNVVGYSDLHVKFVISR